MILFYAWYLAIGIYSTIWLRFLLHFKDDDKEECMKIRCEELLKKFKIFWWKKISDDWGIWWGRRKKFLFSEKMLLLVGFKLTWFYEKFEILCNEVFMLRFSDADCLINCRKEQYCKKLLEICSAVDMEIKFCWF